MTENYLKVQASYSLRCNVIPSGLPALLLFLGHLLATVDSQLSRISQIYPNTGTVTPEVFGFPPGGRFYLSDFEVFVYGEYDGTSPVVRALRKDGTVVQTSTDLNALSSYGLSFCDDAMASFGNSAQITRFTFQYINPNFFVLDAEYSVGHSLDLFVSYADEGSSTYFVSTVASGNLIKYAASDLTTVLLQVNFPDVSSFSVVNPFRDTGLLLAGTQSLIKVVDKAALSTIASWPTTCSPAAITNAIPDIAHQPASASLLDVGCDQYLTRVDVSAATPTAVFASVDFAAPVDDVFEIRWHSYVVVAVGSTVQAVKRTTYDAATMLSSPVLANPVWPGSVACCYQDGHGLAAAMTLNILEYTVIKIDLDFCASYSEDGLTCNECNSGMKLNSTEPGNRCITQDEYPPQFGAKENGISACIDKNCSRCLNSYEECEVCPSPYFINSQSKNCSDLGTIFQFGRDPNNASIIQPCTDANCLDCKANFKVCDLCQVEFFDLRAGTCFNKEGDIVQSSQSFDEKTSTAYLSLSQGFLTPLSSIWPANLSVSITDWQGDEYTDFDSLTVTGDPTKGQIVVSMNLKTSIYGSTIKLTQKSSNPVFYNKNSYMSATSELNITNVRQIRSSLYFTLQSYERWIQLGAWTPMTLSAILGAAHSPLLSIAMLRCVADLNLISHLNGPMLHASDVLLDILGKTSIPIWPLENMFRTPEGQQCEPPGSYQRRYKSYASCSILDSYSKSLLWFALSLIFSIPLQIKFGQRLQKVATQQTAERDIPQLARLAVRARRYGLQFTAMLMLGTTGVAFQLASLTLIDAEQAGPLGVTVAVIILVAYIVLGAALFRFTYLYLDMLHLKELKTGAPFKKDNTDLSPGLLPKPQTKPRSKGTNIVMPKEQGNNAMMKDGKINRKAVTQIGVPTTFQNNNADRDADDSVNGVLGKDNSQSPVLNINANSNDPEGIENPSDAMEHGLSVEERAELKLQLSIMKNRYSFLYFFVSDLKTESKTPRAVLYYLPLYEYVGGLLIAWSVPRLADNGMGQLMFLFAFEFSMVLLLITLNPYSSRLHQYASLHRHISATLLSLIKLASFAPMPEQTVRQAVVDVGCLAVVGMNVLGSAVAAVAATAMGLSALCKNREQEKVTEVVREANRLHSEEVQALEGKTLLPGRIEKAEILPEQAQVEAPNPQSAVSVSASKNYKLDKLARANQLTGQHKARLLADNKKLRDRSMLEPVPEVMLDEDKTVLDGKYSSSMASFEKQLEEEKSKEDVKRAALPEEDITKRSSNSVMPEGSSKVSMKSSSVIVSDFNPDIQNSQFKSISSAVKDLRNNSKILPGIKVLKNRGSDKFESFIDTDKQSVFTNEGSLFLLDSKQQTSKIFAFKNKIGNLRNISEK